MNTHRSTAPLLSLLLSFPLGGGGAEPVVEPQVEESTGSEPDAEMPARGMQVSGLMGTIPERKIQSVLEPRLRKFQPRPG